ncbi:MAG: hypothetical protein ABIQ01_07605 [Pseudolysinimonas sp.]
MGFLDRIFGPEEVAAPAAPRGRTAPTDDERAVERYRYLLSTAPPETIEQVHAEAFAKLTDEQRAVIYEELSKGAGTGERPLSSEPATLARSATRAEMRQPGTLERSFSNPAYRGPGFGSMIASSLIGTVAGYVVGSALVSAFLPWDGGADASDSDADGGSDAGDTSDAGDASGDFGGGDFGGF